MTNISAVEKMAELMQQIEVNSPRVAALHYCLSETARHIAELEQKLAESQREFRAADATIENLQMKLNAEREAKLALAAENAGLKAALNPEVIPEAAVEAFTETVIMDHDWNETSEWSWVENDTDVIRAVLEAIKPETPDTEAFLAEVRAQESKRVYESILDNPAVTDMESLVDWLEQNANDSAAFAAQLRKGVQS
ncbi:hypothetical protein UXO36_00085 [Enterobacter hormaechei]